MCEAICQPSASNAMELNQYPAMISTNMVKPVRMTTAQV